jgi:glyoxylase-like metal-dependent hydrolase (beta-lactamase superfamily II)
VRYVPVDGELELLPGLRLVPAPGHTRGMQVVVVETGGHPVVVGGDVAARGRRWLRAVLRTSGHRAGSGYSSLRRTLSSPAGSFGVRRSRNEWYGATNGSGAVTVYVW